MKKPCFIIVLFLFNQLFAQHTNILISNINNPNEPTIVLNPNNTSQIVAAANLDNYYVSSDGGYTWTEHVQSSSYGVWGDPAIFVDTAGHFYYFHLSNSSPSPDDWIDRIVCQKSTDGGTTWTDGTYMGLNGAKDQDKEWAVVDRNTNHIYVTWTQFDKYDSYNTNDSTVILFSRSVDGGQTWSSPLRLNEVAGDCIDSDNTVEGAVPAVGPNGEIYVAWAGPAGIVFDRSADTGSTWLENDIFVDPMPAGWDYSIPGILRANGLPVTVCDLSNGPYHGTIYINWTDQRNGSDDTDVWLAKSTDGGNTWCAPIRVNDDPPGKQQFFTWMTIDQTNGYLYFVFYDRRNYNDSLTDVYMAVSSDGGNVFTNFKISESPFLPDPGVFFGDYTNITAHDSVIRPIWTRLDNSDLSIWTAIINPDLMYDVKEEQFTANIFLNQNRPNPFTNETFISFKLLKSSIISLKVYDFMGREIKTIIDDQRYDYGKYIERFNPGEYNIGSGIYYYVLKSDGMVLKKKMLHVK